MNKADRTHQLTKPTAPKRQPERINSKNQQPERTNQSGGSNPFYRVKKGAATTPWNALSMAVSAKRVVAVAAVLQNSVVGVLCEASVCARNSPDTYVVCPFLSHSFPFFPFSLPVYAPVCAPARPRVNIIMCVHFPSSGRHHKNMFCNTTVNQPVTNLFQKSSRKTGRYVWLLS